MKEFFGLLAGIVGVAGYVPYIRDTFLRTTRPDRASWLIWSLEYSVLFFAQLAKGAAASLWIVGLQLVGVMAVAGLSIRFGTGQMDRRSGVVLGGVCAALGLWAVTRNASLAIGISLAVEASGVALTAHKVYRQPRSETLTMWWLFAVAGGLGLGSVGHGAPAILFCYPVSLILTSTSVIGAALLGERKARSAAVRPSAPAYPDTA